MFARDEVHKEIAAGDSLAAIAYAILDLADAQRESTALTEGIARKQQDLMEEINNDLASGTLPGDEHSAPG